MSEQNGMIATPRIDVDAVETATPSQVMMFDPSSPKLLAYSTFDRKTEEGFLLVSRMKHDDKKPLGDMIGQLIKVRNFYCQPVEHTDKDTGEVSWFPWICLEDDEGKLYTCGSTGIFASLADALQFRAKVPWVPAMQFRITQRNTKAGRRIYGLIYVPTVPAVEAESEGKKRGKV